LQVPKTSSLPVYRMQIKVQSRKIGPLLPQAGKSSSKRAHKKTSEWCKITFATAVGEL